MSRRPPDYSERILLRVTKSLKMQLELEAWETQVSLEQYIRGLLEKRGKWERSVGKKGGYLIQARIPEVNKSE